MNLSSVFLRQTQASEGRRRPGRMTPVLPPALALLEMGVLAILILAEYAIDGFPQLTRMNPHPYWIAVLLLSLQYGTISGLMAASIAIAGTLLIGLPEPDIEERYFNYLVRVWTQPVLWLLVALLLGSFRARQIEQRDELLHQVDELRTRGATLLDHANNLKARCSRLERTIATRQRSGTGQLLAALSRLSEAEPGRWAPALKTVFSTAFPGSRLSLYTTDGERMRLLLAHSGAQGIAAAERPSSPELTPGSPLLAAVVGAGRSVCVLNATDDVALAGLGVAAVPVFADQQGAVAKVSGLLLAENLSPDLIDEALVQRLSVIAAHLAPVVAQARVTTVTSSLSGSPAAPVTSPVSDVAVPTVRRWRALRWLPGASKPHGNTDG